MEFVQLVINMKTQVYWYITGTDFTLTSLKETYNQIAQTSHIADVVFMNNNSLEHYQSLLKGETLPTNFAGIPIKII